MKRPCAAVIRQGGFWVSFVLASISGPSGYGQVPAVPAGPSPFEGAAEQPAPGSPAQSVSALAAGLPAAKGAIEQPAPVLPAQLVSALQAGQFAAARTALAALRENTKTPDEQSYFAYIQGISERLGGQPDLARKTLSQAIEASPNGRWTSKMRLELAGIELATGNLAAAEELARSEVVRLLAGGARTGLPRSIRRSPAGFSSLRTRSFHPTRMPRTTSWCRLATWLRARA